MADIQYKKGELLLDESVVTGSGYNYVMGTCQTRMFLNQEVLIIDFNGIEYECEANIYESQYIYGGFNLTTPTPDFSIYPFVISNMTSGYSSEDPVVTDTIYLITENPGTYNLKIYTAVEDTDSSTPLSPTDFIIAYLMKSPQNSNWNVLSSLLGDGDWSRLKAYVETTPKNMNRQVLKALLEENKN